jgi:phage recombination protein Bet
MGAVVPFRSAALTRSDARRLALFVKTVGKDLRESEIDEALEWCEVYGANPFTKDIYFFVFDANDANKRRVVPVLGIGLYRKIAARSGNYRPDDRPPRFTYDEAAISQANPKGLVDCEVTVYQYMHGAWHAVASRLKWEERAPIKSGGTTWEKTGEFYPAGHAKAGKPRYRKVTDPSNPDVLDPDKRNWHTMGETMMAKCTEADAIRKGWPNETAGSYVPEEMDALHTIDLTATEIIETHEKTERLSKLGDGPGVMVQWGPADALERVPVGKFGDRVLDWIGAHMIKGSEEPAAVMEWHARNREALREYWAHDKAGALAVKAKLENVAAFAAQVMAAE